MSLQRYPVVAAEGSKTVNNNGAPATRKTNTNTMKADVPPRHTKPDIRRPVATANSAAATGGRNTNNKVQGSITGNKSDDVFVPHVVRVTFLGVAGLLAKPHSNTDSKSQIHPSEHDPSPKSKPVAPASASEHDKTVPVASGHPSLLFHLPSNMRVVASVSRSQAARGIPSGVSKCLFSINDDQKQTTSPTIERLCTPDDHSIGLDVFGQDTNRNSSNVPEKDTKGRTKTSAGSCLDPAPPSQLSHVRSINKGRNGGLGGIAQEPTTNPSTKNIRLASSAATSDDMSKLMGSGSVTSEDHPERLVAVWEKTTKNMASITNATHKFVNLTNSLAFEAELRPSSLMPNTSKNYLRPSPSTAYAPKSFCITVGLVPDYDALVGGNNSSSTPPFGIPVGFANLVINGDETLNGKQRQIDLPLSSIREFLGMLDADVLEKGVFPLIELTSEGLESKNNPEKTTSKTESTEKKKKNIVKRIFARKHPHSSAVGDDSSAQIPSVYSGTPTSIFQLDRPPTAKERALFLDQYSVDRDAIVRIGLEVFPRGSELEKVFRQKKRIKKNNHAASKVEVGKISAPSNNDQRNQLKQTNQSSASGVRASKLASSEETASKDGRPTSSTASVGSRGFNTAESVGLSLVDEDDDDEAMLDSDSDASSLSQSFFTLDSDTTWDDSTTYTDTLSSFYTVGGDSMSSAISAEETTMEKETNSKHDDSSPGFFLSRFMNCHVPTNCGVDDDNDTDISRVTPKTYSNIDTVTSAIASMSMSDEGSRATAWAEHESQVNSIISKSSRPIHSDASVDTTKQRTNAIPPTPTEKRREDNASTVSVKSKTSGDRPPLSIDSGVPMEGRTITIQDEVSPLALIIQRITNNDADGDDEFEAKREKPQQKQFVDEGHEFTLEDHQSASGNSA